MRLEGSCHCRTVRFSLESRNPVPYQRCYCSICRKTNGGGGYAINLSGDYESLEVEGKRHIRAYQAVLRADDGTETRSEAQRMFCAHCGSGLWLYDERWPDLVHPFASAIDTPLPVPPEHTHLMLRYAPDWVEPQIGENDKRFEEYPEESIADWHRRLGMEE
ncbi:GFA family protein [Acetobacteraceae bacterium KSS8]|uniref:GFA family protein n=1 Tax=Endosaccharibacter trunci TaxID=2812733 RepID=A0ABT1W9X9_9PROT|nr:GFA family protein [Acetobacteraceae bacterium KSS8]